jgi:hypothetical protein
VNAVRKEKTGVKRSLRRQGRYLRPFSVRESGRLWLGPNPGLLIV